MNNKQLEQTINKLIDIKLGNKKVEVPKGNLPEEQEGKIEYSPILPLFSNNTVEHVVEGTVYAVKGVFVKLADGMGYKNNDLLYNYSGNVAVCVNFKEGISTISVHIDPKYPIQTVSPMNNRAVNIRETDWAFKLEYMREQNGNVN